MIIIQDIIFALIICSFVFVLTSILLWLAVTFCADPYCSYKLHKRKNKIQWKCVETETSRLNRIKNDNCNLECKLYFRILPSELSLFVRIFGNNEWNSIFGNNEWNNISDYDKKFNNENEFKEFVKRWKTYGDIEDYINGKNKVIWYEP